MHDISAAEDQVSLIPQRCEFFSDRIALCSGEPSVYGELNHRDIGLWKHMYQNRPCAVIDSPTVIDGYLVSQQVLHLGRELFVPMNRVLHCIQFCGETIHIIDLPGNWRTLHICAVCVPVCRNRQYCLRFSVMLCDVTANRSHPFCNFIILNGNHRTAVPGENYRHSCTHDVSLPAI